MKPFKNVLYVTEESVDQVSAVARAVSFAENNHARLTVIDVISPIADAYRSDIVNYQMQKLESLIKPYQNRLEIHIDVVEGTTFLEVIRAVLRNGYDLVIKAAENPDFLEKLFGSNDKKGLNKLAEALRDRIGTDAYNRLSPIFHLPKGPAKKMIALVAAELRADLVVMGTVARTGISGLIIGNTAETILDQLTCSVLAIKPPGFMTPVKLDE